MNRLKRDESPINLSLDPFESQGESPLLFEYDVRSIQGYVYEKTPATSLDRTSSRGEKFSSRFVPTNSLQYHDSSGVRRASGVGLSTDNEKTRETSLSGTSPRGGRSSSRFAPWTNFQHDVSTKGGRVANPSERERYEPVHVPVSPTRTRRVAPQQGSSETYTVVPGALSVVDGHARRLSKAELSSPAPHVPRHAPHDTIEEEEEESMKLSKRMKRRRLLAPIAILIILVAVVAGTRSRKGKDHFQHVPPLNQTESISDTERWKAIEEILIRRNI